jgi:hypothetical protein
MVDRKSNEASQASLLPGALNPRGLVLTPLLIRILALVAVMLLANLS